jgi:glycerophosphodiester phosphodiesterase
MRFGLPSLLIFWVRLITNAITTKGIVTVSDPLVEAPHLTKTVKENGLLLFSYGHLNNQVECVELQRRFGVDAVIVDKIVPIVDSLKISN